MSEIIFPIPAEEMTEEQRLKYDAEVAEILDDYYDLVEGFGQEDGLEEAENASKGNPNHDPKSGRFTFGPGGKAASAMQMDEFEELANKATLEQVDYSTTWLMKQIYKKQGFNAKPEVVSDEEFQKLPGETQYRGIIETRGNGELKRLFKEGPSHYPGTGIFGNGTYVTPSASVARGYSSSDSLLNMKIKPGAKAVAYTDIVNGAFVTSRQMSAKAEKLLKSDDESTRLLGYKYRGISRALGDPGVYAASQGYDYMTVDSENASQPQSVLFNRGAVIVNETNARSSM